MQDKRSTCKICGVSIQGKKGPKGQGRPPLYCLKHYGGRTDPKQPVPPTLAEQALSRLRLPKYLTPSRLRRYGFTVEAYLSLLAEQGYRCAICDKIPESWLVIDHNHVTGATRGLLCTTCNAGLGHFADNPSRLERAANYLRRHAS